MTVRREMAKVAARDDARACTGAVAVARGMWARAAAAAAAVALAATLAFAFAWPGEGGGLAWADEPADGDNAVNPQQLPDSSFIYDTSIDDLASADAYYDNQTVQVAGEVIGDSIREGLEGRHRWITLASESGSTVSIWMPAESAAKIDTFGSYAAKGTTLQVRGTFHLVCREHAGESDLHAEVVNVVKPGSETPDELNLAAFAPGVLLIVVGLALTGVYYWLRERQR